MIQKVIEFRAERYFGTFAQRELLPDRRVPDDEPRAADHSDAAVAEPSNGWRGEGCRVEPALFCAIALDGSAGSIGASRQPGAGNRQAGCQSQSALHGNEAAELPIAEDLAQYIAAMPEPRDVVNVVHAEHMGAIEIHGSAVGAPVQDVLRGGVAGGLTFTDGLAECVGALQGKTIRESPLERRLQ